GVADVDPYRLVLALTQACEAMGVIIQHGDVNGLNKADGRIARIKTTRGELSCNTLVIALGPWTGDASRWLGLPIPIRPLKGQIVRLNSPLTPVPCSVGWEGNYACTKPDGLLWAGTTEEDAGFDESPTSKGRDEILISLRKMIPRLDEAELVQQTACLRPLSKDGRIILGRIPKRENVLIATGTGRKGILLGPAMGKLVSELVTDGYTETNIEPFRVNRF
ncbi:MAG: FAD-binding oxidoreductase, partial [Dehalococcoidia bacterium]|nr:FAD-binding oxidoreductase [Dehalococcoidia bacterium]